MHFDTKTRTGIIKRKLELLGTTSIQICAIALYISVFDLIQSLAIPLLREDLPLYIRIRFHVIFRLLHHFKMTFVLRSISVSEASKSIYDRVFVRNRDLW